MALHKQNTQAKHRMRSSFYLCSILKPYEIRKKVTSMRDLTFNFDTHLMVFLIPLFWGFGGVFTSLALVLIPLLMTVLQITPSINRFAAFSSTGIARGGGGRSYKWATSLSFRFRFRCCFFDYCSSCYDCYCFCVSCCSFCSYCRSFRYRHFYQRRSNHRGSFGLAPEFP